jgi:hypothetical protein
MLTKIGQWDWKIQHAKMGDRGMQKSSPKSKIENLKLKEHKEEG